MSQGIETVPVVRMFDPALDVDSDAASVKVLEYAKDRDPKVFPSLLKQGESPTVFYVRRATRKGVRYIRSGADDDEKRERAFAVCVQKVQDHRRADGGRQLIEHPNCDGAQPMPDAYLEHFAESDIQEIGGVALKRSFLAREVQPRFPLLPISLDALSDLYVHSAGLTPSSAPSSATSSEKPSPAPQPETKAP